MWEWNWDENFDLKVYQKYVKLESVIIDIMRNEKKRNSISSLYEHSNYYKITGRVNERWLTVQVRRIATITRQEIQLSELDISLADLILMGYNNK